MSHTLYVQIECTGDAFYFWSYVHSDARLIAERVSPEWTSAALAQEDPEVLEPLVRLKVASVEEREEAVEDAFWLVYRTRAFATGGSANDYLVASRACPNTQITIYEWLPDLEEFERTTVRDGLVISHYHASAESDFELYKKMVEMIFNSAVEDPF